MTQLEIKTREDGGRWIAEVTFSSLFSMGDFIDLPAFVTKLSTQQDPISKFLWDQFPDPTREVLKNAKSTPEEKKKELIKALDNILKGGASIYEEMRFHGVALSPKTIGLKSQNPIGKELIRLNRLLLEDAYPLEIAKSLSFQGVMAYGDSAKEAQRKVKALALHVLADRLERLKEPLPEVVEKAFLVR